MDNEDILKFINEEETISMLQKMIGFDTVNEPGNEKPLADFINGILNDVNIENFVDEIDTNRSNIIGRIRGSGKRPALLLNGHLDTVPPGDVEWKYNPFSGKLIDGKIFGRGSADMKGGLSAMLIAFIAVKKAGWKLKGDLIYSGTIGEESDSIGAIKFVQDGGLEGVGAIIIGEPSSNGVNITEKGALWLEITTYGKTAHGAFPEEGLNAIVFMNHVLNKLINYKLEYVPSEILGNPSINISTISGGVKTNVVPDRCRLTVDIRTVHGMSHEEIIKDISNILKDLSIEIHDLKANIEVKNNRPAVETKSSDDFVQLAIKTIEDEFGKIIKPGGVNFYTDASIFLPAKEGIPCIFYGPGDANMAHQPNEYVSIASLMEAVQFYCGIIEKYLVI